MNWTIEYTREDGTSYRQGLYAQREMAEMNVRLCNDMPGSTYTARVVEA